MRLYGNYDERCEIIAEYLIDNSSTVRECAKHFGISKSTVHKDIRDRLQKVNPSLYYEAIKILEKNKRERHIRGGIATKNKYYRLRSKLISS
ncbi:MAG: sporulation transcriptional regulator SpoIIID [Clostridia bacterium]|nr:sporulation transcriptional regulator SpoIIID [Clostridia bacterium]